MLNAREIENAIVEEIRLLLTGTDLVGVEIGSDCHLTRTLHLDSLMMASLLIALEGRFGRDPFLEDLSIADVASVGDLVRAYQPVAAAPALA
ncbi:acyl carrier protein [Azospirillum sp. Vi22]|uniref:acyl carrier protein n=1 Tax=Azospirillum baldaniorum TaxID=1064539 RepID=UPI00157A2C33|nr:acyl carrier protein [Azospirillum baldaniorum]NUB04887.1 acyl carrier protein [Azospirillum baldaniorum]